MMFIPTAAPLSAWPRCTQAAGNLDEINIMQMIKGTSGQDFCKKQTNKQQQKKPLIPDDLSDTLRENNILKK